MTKKNDLQTPLEGQQQHCTLSFLQPTKADVKENKWVKGAASRQSSPICLVFPVTRPYLLWNLTLAKKLLVNDKTTAL